MTRFLFLLILALPLAPAEIQTVGPTVTVQTILDDPAAGARAVEDLARSAPNPPPTGFPWGKVGLVAAAVGAVVLRLAKNMPGLGGVYAGIAEGLWKTVAPQKYQVAEQAGTVALRESVALAQVAIVALRVSNPDMANDIVGAAEAVQKRLGIHEIIAPVLAEVRAGGSPLVAVGHSPTQVRDAAS